MPSIDFFAQNSYFLAFCEIFIFLTIHSVIFTLYLSHFLEHCFRKCEKMIDIKLAGKGWFRGRSSNVGHPGAI